MQLQNPMANLVSITETLPLSPRVSPSGQVLASRCTSRASQHSPNSSGKPDYDNPTKSSVLNFEVSIQVVRVEEDPADQDMFQVLRALRCKAQRLGLAQYRSKIILH